MAKNGVSSTILQQELESFGLEYDDDGVPERMLELCVTHRLTEGKLVDEWVAFSTGKHLPLTVDNLNLLEHEILNKKASKARQKVVKREQHSGTRDINSIQELIKVEEAEENLLESYGTPAKGSQKRILSTPENPQSKRISTITRSPHLLFSPSSFSPRSRPVIGLKDQCRRSRISRVSVQNCYTISEIRRTGSRGEVVTSFGAVHGTSWSGSGGQSANVKIFSPEEDSLTKSYKFMFQKLLDIREVLSGKIEDLGYSLKEHFQIEDFSAVSMPAQEPVTLLGQIGCDSNGKLNAKSVLLEGDKEHSSGMQVPVDLSELKDYSLFPGQVVVMEGTNSTGRKLVASKLYEGVPLPFYKPPETSEGCEQQMVLVACGPYTTSDSITFDPMMDLIDVINRDKPDVCFLFGPFLDVKHEQVENCQLTVPFEDVFNRCLKMIIEGTRSSGSKLVFVPSLRDVHHEFVYPQPPFSCYVLAKEDKQRVQFVSDPCTLDVSGVVFGITSTDLLFHMGAEEISSSSGASDRFTRILKHILTQRRPIIVLGDLNGKLDNASMNGHDERLDNLWHIPPYVRGAPSYYPLYPPSEEINIDYESFYNYAQMQVTPDVFIVPSELRYFIKDVFGCICVNPGRLTKGQVGGTYGRLFIKREDGGAKGRVSPCVSAQVVKI